MSRPLPPGDPVQLGPFRLSARLSESPAGIVYLGVDDAGRRVSVAVLNRGAAGDAAARDRFRAAINAAVPGPGRAVDAGGAPVVAARVEGSAPWVATVYEADRAGAERFLEPVLLSEAGRSWWGGRRRGPQFQPYWLGSVEPAVESRRPGPGPGPGPVGERPPERSLVAGVLVLAVLLGVVVLLMGVLFACQPVVREPAPPPPEPTPTFPQPSPTTPSPSPSGPPTTPGSPSPSPSGTGDGGEGGPL